MSDEYEASITSSDSESVDSDVEDYPFTSWESFYACFVKCNSTEFYASTYPKYAKAMEDDWDKSCFSQIMRDFLEQGLDPQEGLDGMIQAFIDGPRYVEEFMGDGEAMFTYMTKEFIEKGAKLNFDNLMKPTIESLEDEFIWSGKVKGRMLSDLKNAGIVPDMDEILDEKLNWNDITPWYWEDIPEEEMPDFNTQFLSALKYDYYKSQHKIDDEEYDYNKAKKEIKECLKDGKEVVIEHLSFLVTLPPLPDDVESLEISSCYELKNLPNPLPSKLKRLICDQTSISEYPPLPPGLIYFNCRGTHIQKLPPLPDSLEEIDCGWNPIEHLPNPLPKNLKILNCSNSEIISLPPLPDGLEELDCSDTKITELPSLPNSLDKLEISNTRLKTLPPLPSSLQRLFRCMNRIPDDEYLPSKIPIETPAKYALRVQK
jgi:hypothetical protein